MARSMGVKSQRILRDSADPNEVVILNEFDDINKARQFANSDELKQAMQRAGLVDTPSSDFLNEADRIIL
jgi:heme-degrading monooxygenase HmoA